MKVAIMQPYVFPYIGYFQLINAVDTFIFYDDVNFIKKGFINRNRLLINGKRTPFNIACQGISQNKKINKIVLDNFSFRQKKLIKLIEHNYKKAPFFNDIFPIIKEFILNFNKSTISELAMDSVIIISKYLDISTEFKTSSSSYSTTQNLVREHRLIEICKRENATEYINSIGGRDLYKKSDFAEQSIQLNFIEPKAIVYKQFSNEFVPWLSIIDVLMFNRKEQVLDMLNEYKLV